MWDKLTRQAIFSAIYQIVFFQDQELDWNIDWEYILENSPKITEETDIPSFLSLTSYLDLFYEKRGLFESYLKIKLPNWESTFPLIKACLYTFLTEYSYITTNFNDFDKEALLGKYIKLSQETIGGQSVTLVHAVTSKIIQNGLTTE